MVVTSEANDMQWSRHTNSSTSKITRRSWTHLAALTGQKGWLLSNGVFIYGLWKEMTDEVDVFLSALGVRKTLPLHQVQTTCTCWANTSTVSCMCNVILQDIVLAISDIPELCCNHSRHTNISIDMVWSGCHGNLTKMDQSRQTVLITQPIMLLPVNSVSEWCRIARSTFWDFHF